MSGFQGKKGTRPSQYFATLLQAGIPAPSPQSAKATFGSSALAAPSSPRGIWVAQECPSGGNIGGGRPCNRARSAWSIQRFYPNVEAPARSLDEKHPSRESPRPAKVPVPTKGTIMSDIAPRRSGVTTVCLGHPTV